MKVAPLMMIKHRQLCNVGIKVCDDQLALLFIILYHQM